MEYRVTCIQKAATEDSVTVTDLGGFDDQGERWTMSVEEVAEAIAAGEKFLLEDKPLAGVDPLSKQLLKLPSCP
jgi:ABC-type lipopolysaccharide export system ATPase subunit